MQSAWTRDLAESKGPLQLLRIEKGGYGPFGRHIVDHRPAERRFHQANWNAMLVVESFAFPRHAASVGPRAMKNVYVN